MKKLLALAITIVILINGCTTTGTNKVSQKLEQDDNKNYPVLKVMILEVKSNSPKYYGKTLAFEGKIIKKVKGDKDKSYLKLEIIPDAPKVVKFTLWARALGGDNRYLEIGDTIKVLGILSKIENIDHLSKKYNKDNSHLLVYCFFNIDKEKAFSVEGTTKQCNDWRDGYIK